MKTIKLYWHRGPGRSNSDKQNFGDYLSPLIVEAVSGKRVEYAPLPKADMMAIGTILGKERKAKRFGLKRRLHVWGSGCGQPEESYSSRHYYHAVRGQETVSRIQGQVSPLALGDPGLLAPMLIDRPVDKHYKIGFVPHYVDQALPTALSFINNFPEVHFINVFMPPLQVLKEIAACEFIVSSSLHGLVVADAFNVPNIRVRLSSGIIDELKFDDYYSVFNINVPELLPGENLHEVSDKYEELSHAYARPNLGNIQSLLLKNFPEY